MAENRELALVLKLVADQFQNELKKSQGSLSSFNNFIKDWKTQLAAAGTALFAIAKSTANYGEEALKSSQRLGMTVEATTALQHAANMADVPMSTLEKGLKTLAQNAVEAAQGTGEGAKLFNALGLSATDASGKIKPLDQLFFEFQDRLKGVHNQAQFVDAGVKSFGKSFLDMVPFIKQGSEATKEAMEEGKRFGVVLTKDEAEAANRFNDEIKKLNAAMRGLTLEAGRPLIGVLTELMQTFSALSSNGASQFFFKGLAEQAVLFSTMIKEAAANVEFLFGKFTFDQLRTEIARLEAEASAKLLLLENPKAAKYVNGPASAGGTPNGGGGTDGGALFADQEKLGKAKLEIFNAQNRALEIQNKLAREAAQGTNLDFLKEDRRLQREAEDEAEQERFGQRIVERTQLEVAIREAAAAQERDQLVQNAQAWMAYDDQIGASNEQRYAHQLDLVRANLAQQTELTTAESGRLLLAWQNHDEQLAQEILARTTLTAQQKETLELQSLTRVAAANEQASDDIFAGWSRGMERYAQDTKSGFGMAADMARRTAQAMEQGFQSFFFDVFDGKVKDMKDVLSSLGNFARQISGMIFSQLATKAIVSSFGLGANAGGMVVQRFAMGGPVLGTGNRDTVPALLTPGEFVLSRQDVSDIKRGAGLPNVQVINHNYTNAKIDTTLSRGSDGQMVITQVIRDTVRGLVNAGDLDGPLSRRYNVQPQPGRR